MFTVTLIGIIAAFAFFAAAQRIHINNLNAEIDRERARHEVTKTQSQTQLKKATDERDHALKEAKVENDLRRQAERNLHGMTKTAEYWMKESQMADQHADILSKKANQIETELAKYSRPRDPKTGRFYSVKPRPTAKEMEQGLAEFDAMMGNAIEQLQGLTIR